MMHVISNKIIIIVRERWIRYNFALVNIYDVLIKWRCNLMAVVWKEVEEVEVEVEVGVDLDLGVDLDDPRLASSTLSSSANLLPGRRRRRRRR